MSPASEPCYPFVHVDVAPELSDALSEILFELGAEGVEVRDTTTLHREERAGMVTLVASFASREEAELALEQLDEELSPRLIELVGDGWRDAWKEHYRPFALSPHVLICPPWETPPPLAEGQHLLVLEPGRAFGTGLHATTALLAELLDRHPSWLQGKHVLDVGTGSGILGLIALALGASQVEATDVDEDAVQVAMENALRNHRQESFHASTASMETLTGRFPLVLANIEAKVILPMARALMERVTPGGHLLLSGLLVEQESAVREAFSAFRWLSCERRDEWIAPVLLAPET